MKHKIQDWWNRLSAFEQFWLFWFAVVLGGVGVVLFINQFIY